MLCTFGYTVLFLGKHYQSVLQSPGCAQARASAACSIKIPFYSKHAVPFPFTNKPECQREEEEEEAATARPTSEVTVRCAGDKQSVSPAFKSCVSAVVVAGSIAPRLLLLPLLLLYAPAPLHTLQYQLRDTVTVFTQRWRPSSCHRAMQAQLQQHAFNVSIILLSPG